MRIWNINTGEQLCIIPHSNWIGSIAISQDRQYMLIGDYCGFLYKWNISLLPKPLIKGTVSRCREGGGGGGGDRSLFS